MGATVPRFSIHIVFEGVRRIFRGTAIVEIKYNKPQILWRINNILVRVIF